MIMILTIITITIITIITTEIIRITEITEITTDSFASLKKGCPKVLAALFALIYNVW